MTNTNVLSGTWCVGMGDRFDERACRDMRAGFARGRAERVAAGDDPPQAGRRAFAAVRCGLAEFDIGS
jgi:hypothetical protein